MRRTGFLVRTTFRVGMVGLVVLACLGVQLSAQTRSTFVVTYFEGECSVQQGQQWVSVDFGEELPVNATVRLGRASVLSVEGMGASYSLAQAGTYKIQDLVSRAQNGAARAASSTLDTRIARLTTDRALKDTNVTVGGVRANAQDGKSDPVQWAEIDSSEQILAQASQLLEKNQIRQASEILKKQLDVVLRSERPSYSLDAAALLLKSGYTAAALGYIRDLSLADNHPRYAEFAILKARVLYEVQDYALLLGLSDAALPLLRDLADKQALLIFKYMALLMLQRGSEARQALEQAILLDPKSPLALEAASLLSNS